MRIIAGRAKGRALAKPKHKGVRPTTDRIRESLFSILGPMTDRIILDGFAGTGALGCEALSRGAQFAYFFDQSRASIALIKDNVSRIDAQHQSMIRQGRMTQNLRLLQHPVDLIFLDPPYNTPLIQEALDALHHCDHLASNATLVLEQEIDESLPTFDPQRFELVDQRTYGRTRLSFLDCLDAQSMLSDEES